MLPLLINAALDVALFAYLVRWLRRLERGHTHTHRTLTALCSREAHIACLDSIFGIEVNGRRPVLTCTRVAGHHGRHRNDQGTEWERAT
jgi:hypothetical protein